MFDPGSGRSSDEVEPPFRSGRCLRAWETGGNAVMLARDNERTGILT